MVKGKELSMLKSGENFMFYLNPMGNFYVIDVSKIEIQNDSKIL